MQVFRSATLAAGLLAATSSSLAHISYTGRDFGTFDGLSVQSASINDQAVTSNYGWADATDFNFGDSHRGRAFRFTLTGLADITIDVSANASATATSLGGLLPGFSVYEGLAHLAPVAADHDFSVLSQAWLASLPGEPKEGAWVATGDWKIGNDTGTTFSDLSSFTFKGYAVDGTAANFSNAHPGIVGDGLADGHVNGTFRLGAGSYTLFMGGADYHAQDPSNPNLLKSYGIAAALSVTPVPEPETVGLMLIGLLAISLRKRNALDEA